MKMFFDWISNKSPHWTAYCAFMSGFLFALDKQPDVRSFGFGENRRHLFANILPMVIGTESTMACQDDQLCAGLKAGIDGVVHGVQNIWDKSRPQRIGCFCF